MIERLLVRNVLVIFIDNSVFGYTFRTKLLKILRCSIKADIFALIFDSWHYFLSHLRFDSQIIFPVL